MRILVNALSATSIAGEHVVRGLLGELVRSGPPWCQWLVYVPDGPLRADLDGLPGVQVVTGPGLHWTLRSVWEARQIPRAAARWAADWVVNYSGVHLPRVDAPQVVFAVNPRPLTPVSFRTVGEAFKGSVQRRLYRAAADRAALTVYNSAHLRSLYIANGAPTTAPYLVVPHGLPSDAQDARPDGRRVPFAVVSAAVWSQYKGPSTLLKAIARLRTRHRVPASLTLAGPWVSDRHRAAVGRLTDRLGIGEAVRIEGHLPRPRLIDEYARAQVFALPSQTESFGIPAVEAQAAGTPVVGSSTTAMPEVCGAGGVYCPPGDPAALAETLRPVLTDLCLWDRLSAAATENARRYTWDQCAGPLLDAMWARSHRAAA